MKFCVLLFAAAVASAQTASAPALAQERVGPLPAGGFLLDSGWTLKPAGKQVAVGTFPMSAAVSNDGKYLLVLNGGYNPPSISVIDIASRREIGRTRLPDAWLGLTVAPDSNLVYVGGGSTAKVYELSLDSATGALTRQREFAAVPDLSNKGVAFIGDVALSASGRLIYAADLYGNGIAVIDLRSGKLLGTWKACSRPYRIIVAPGGGQLFVSSWGDGCVYRYDTSNGGELSRTRVGPHPSDMLWLNEPPPVVEATGSSYAARLFVAASNTNNVYSFGAARDGSLTMLESINVSMTPMHPLGMTPSALAVDRDHTHLYIVCSDANAIAVADISGSHTRVLGFIPTGWYPTAVRVLANGEIAMLNGKGLRSYPNPDGPNPMKSRAPVHGGLKGAADVQYIPHIQTGTAAFLPAPDESQLARFTRTTLANSPYRDDLIYGPATNDQDSFFSQTEEHPSPIQHVIYVIKENRTYDQVLGDLPEGNGDPSLVLFGEQITPNLHKLAQEYILYDNFYENSDVSADGHNWLSAAIAPDYTVKLWPNQYGHRSKIYDFEGGEPANTPPAGYIWDNAIQAGISVRDYGEWVENIPLSSVNSARQVDHVNDSALKQYVDMNYRGFDLDYSDIDRATEFIREWKQFAAGGEAPHMIILRLGNDHTKGTRPGALTPLAYNAQNDCAVGMVVDAVSHSALWSSTAILIMEDDSQDGPDHVDSHRAPAWVISPYTHRGIVDSTMYNQMSMLRTMELILGLRPLTHFDAGARSMLGTFSRQADTQPYTVIRPKISLKETNAANAPGAAASLKMDFSDADRIDDDELNAVLWRAIKHADSPVPTRSAFGH
jgi:DNA-binding beta-propeller fold protein YncE